MEVNNKTMRLNKRTVKFDLQKNTITFYIGDFSRTYKYNNFDDEKHLIHEILLQTFMADYENRGNLEQSSLLYSRLSKEEDQNIPVDNLLSSECKPSLSDKLKNDMGLHTPIISQGNDEEYNEIKKKQMIKECNKKEDLLFQQQETTEINNNEELKESNHKNNESINNSVDLESILNRKYNIKNIFDIPNDNH